MTRAARWTDPRYVARLRESERLTGVAVPFLLDALALDPAERVLDIGCGIGGATLSAAAAMGPGGAVVGVDISHSAAEAATRRAAGSAGAPVTVRVLDAEVGCIDGGPFSAAMSNFGVMFFADPVAAFRNVRRHLAADGRLCFTCWQAADRNPWSYAADIADLLPPQVGVVAAESPPGPFSLADPALVRRLLDRAGFGKVKVTPYATAVDLPRAAVVDDTELALMGVPAKRMREAGERVRTALKPYGRADGLLRLPIAFFVVTATARDLAGTAAVREHHGRRRLRARAAQLG